MSGDEPPHARLWALALHAATVSLFFGIGSAFVGWAPGALLALAGVAVTGTIHLVIGVVSYRAVMRRPWPNVELVPDDDDW